jgi:geranyl-CoA carboxylase alpha subunit
MIAKVIAHGATREEARRRLVAALSASAVFGPRTNRDFLIDALQQPAFADGGATTAFIGEVYGDRFTPAPVAEAVLATAAVVQHACALRRASASAIGMSAELLDWSSTNALQTFVEYETGGAVRKLSVRPRGRGTYDVADGDRRHDVSIAEMDDETARFRIDGETLGVTYRDDGHLVFLSTAERTLSLANLATLVRAKKVATGQGVLLAPMHGKLVEVCVTEGADVKKGDRLAVLEAMKMQNELVAEIDGRVVRIAATAGSQIAAQTLILEIEPSAGLAG